MAKDRIQILIQKRFNHTLSPEDKAELKAVIKDPELRKELSFQLGVFLAFKQKDQEEKREIQQLLNDLRGYSSTLKPDNGATADIRRIEQKKNIDGLLHRLIASPWSRAAVFLLTASALVWLLFSIPHSKEINNENKALATLSQKQKTKTQEEIPPNKVVLLYSDVLGGSTDDSTSTSSEIPYYDCIKLLGSLNYSLAIDCFEKYDTLIPNINYFHLGWSYLKRGESGDYEKALLNFEKIDKPSPLITKEDINFHKWITLILLGRPSDQEKFDMLKSELSSEYGDKVKQIEKILKKK